MLGSCRAVKVLLITVVLQGCGNGERDDWIHDVRLVEQLQAGQVDLAGVRKRLGADPVPGLCEALKHPNPMVRQWAAGILAQTGSAAAPAVPTLLDLLLEADRRSSGAALLALVGAGPAAVPHLVAALGNPDMERRRVASRVLVGLGESAVPELCQSLQHADAMVRLEVCSVLASIAQERQITNALPALTSALRDEHAGVRAWSCVALGILGKTAMDTVPDLMARLRDPDTGVRDAAAQALRRIRDAGGEDSHR